MIVLALALPAACGKSDVAPKQVDRAAATASATMPPSALPAVATAPADPVTIDPEPQPDRTSEVVERHDIVVNGRPACAFSIRYVGAIDQPATWNGEACSAVTAKFVDAAALRSLGRFDALDEETRDDIAQSGGAVFYVEGEAASAIFPLNSAKRVYKVRLGD